MHVVFDTNVLVSALLVSNSLPSNALEIAENEGVVLYSLPVLDEINEVLSRPKFRRYISEARISAFLSGIYSAWQQVTILKAVRICHDPKDDKFLELALNGQADFLVTGDRDLLALKTYHDTIILNPADYLRSS